MWICIAECCDLNFKWQMQNLSCVKVRELRFKGIGFVFPPCCIELWLSSCPLHVVLLVAAFQLFTGLLALHCSCKGICGKVKATVLRVPLRKLWNNGAEFDMSHNSGTGWMDQLQCKLKLV